MPESRHTHTHMHAHLSLKQRVGMRAASVCGVRHWVFRFHPQGPLAFEENTSLAKMSQGPLPAKQIQSVPGRGEALPSKRRLPFRAGYTSNPTEARSGKAVAENMSAQFLAPACNVEKTRFKTEEPLMNSGLIELMLFKLN